MKLPTWLIAFVLEKGKFFLSFINGQKRIYLDDGEQNKNKRPAGAPVKCSNEPLGPAASAAAFHRTAKFAFISMCIAIVLQSISVLRVAEAEGGGQRGGKMKRRHNSSDSPCADQ
jgi:hypothetical protein